MMLHGLKYELRKTERASRIIINGEEVGKPTAVATTCIEGNNNNNNNNNNYMQLGCHPVAVVILHVYKI